MSRQPPGYECDSCTYGVYVVMRYDARVEQLSAFLIFEYTRLQMPECAPMFPTAAKKLAKLFHPLSKGLGISLER